MSNFNLSRKAINIVAIAVFSAGMLLVALTKNDAITSFISNIGSQIINALFSALN
ncbi:MAG: hypothetical protein LBM97_01250 [Candidatus Nomurabacteria bacterium]|nr:hypothetical protein [Candidatus Nomurabacteria bacterium]